MNVAKRKPAIRLARKLFDDGYDYSQYDVSPIDVAMCLGDRSIYISYIFYFYKYFFIGFYKLIDTFTNVFLDKDTVYMKSGAKRPEWTLFAKITQHMETVLFREKFADWPDYSRVIKLSKKNDEKENGEQDKCVSIYFNIICLMSYRV